MALINCSECGKEISDKAGTCPNCGYKIKKPNNKKIFYVTIIIFFILIASIIFLVIRNFNLSSNEKIALNICRELQSNLKYRNSLELYEIYVNNETSSRTTIKYTDRVYIKYKAKNSYGEKQSNEVLCLISISENNFIWWGDNEQGDAYLLIAEEGIYGYVFEKDENWEKIDENKIMRKLE